MNEAEAARRLFAQKCACVLAAAIPEQFPDTALPEIAFAGRSNVGKSSLINALMGQKNLARASKTPGRTQQIVFFNLAERLMFADLPGYGFAKAPEAHKAQWGGLIRRYLQTRAPLRCVCLLIDSRHGFLAHDLDMMKMLDRAAVSYQIILTKADHLSALARDKRVREIVALLAKHPAARPDVLLTSATKNIGIDAVREFLAAFAGG